MPISPTAANELTSLKTRVPGLRLRAGTAAATVHRSVLGGVSFIGVTGSCGKTTTKELIAAALGTQLRGRKSPGQGNGLAVVSKTMLRTTRKDAFCVIELAAGRASCLPRAARMVRPRIAVVTNVGSDHRSLYRTLERTAAEKRTLVDAVVPGGAAVLNVDNPHVIAMARGFHGRVITFGCSPEAMLRAETVRSTWPEPLSFTLVFGDRSLPVRTGLHGSHWVHCSLAALAVAVVMEVPLERAIQGLGEVSPTPGRMSPVTRDGVTFILDDIKAPWWAIHPVLDFLAEARAERKIIVIGTISDYPGSASKKYRAVAERAMTIADEVIFVGPNSSYVAKVIERSPSGRLRAFQSIPEARDCLHAILRTGDLVVLKGSEVDGLHRIAIDQQRLHKRPPAHGLLHA